MLRRAMVLSVVAVLLPVAETSAQQESDAEPNVLEVTALDYSFQSSASEIPAGWTTIELHNKGEKTHVVELARLPEGVSLKEFGDAFATYDSITSELQAGSIDSATALKLYKQKVPGWINDLAYRAGPGLLAPGRSTSTTVRLEPGQYIMTCSVKNSEGAQHFRLGMMRPLTVTETRSSASAPTADMTLRLSKYEIHTEGELEPGEQTIAIEYGEREGVMEEPFQGVHLARLNDGASVDEVMRWPRTRRTPAPAEFLGGAIAQPPGNRVYVTMHVSPGQYAWVSHASQAKGMVKEFTVQ